MRVRTRALSGVAILALLAACGRPMPSTRVVRPLALEVVDAETGRPLPGIRVYRLYTTARYAGSNPLEPSGHRYLLSATETDAAGRARLPRDEVRLDGREHFTHEGVYVNLEAAPDFTGWDRTPGGRLSSAVLEAWSPDHAGSVVTPAAAYRGFVIESIDSDWDLARQGAPERPRYDVLWNSRGLARPEETIVVELRRHRAPAPR